MKAKSQLEQSMQEEQIRTALNAHDWESEWRDRTGFNNHPELIPAVNLLMR
jgi:hypothetical protein